MLKVTPGTLLKEFTLYPRADIRRADGRPGRTRGKTGTTTLRAVVSEIQPKTDIRARQYDYPATHRLIVRGRTGVREGDVLMRGGESYYVWAVHDMGLMGIYTEIICQRRNG